MARYVINDDYEDDMDILSESFGQQDINATNGSHTMQVERQNMPPAASLASKIEDMCVNGIASALTNFSIGSELNQDDSVVMTAVEPAAIEVVLDCANIGWFFGNDSFDMVGVLLAFAFLRQFGPLIKIAAFLPASYLRRKPADGTRGNTMMQTENWEMVDNLVKSRVISIVPAGNNDDLYILNYAWQHNGYIISNDFYMDHIAAKDNPVERQAMIQWLLDIRCSFTFVRDQFMLSPDSQLYAKLQEYTTL